MSSSVNEAEATERIYLKRGCEEASARTGHTEAPWPHSPAKAAGDWGAPSSRSRARTHTIHISTVPSGGPSAFQNLSVWFGSPLLKNDKIRNL